MHYKKSSNILSLALVAALSVTALAQTAAPTKVLRPATEFAPDIKMIPTGGTGWAKSEVNAAVFRTSSVVSYDDTQFIAFYDGDANVILGKRKLSSPTWELKTTQYKGSAGDAHNSISLGIDGKGVLHMVWDLHNQKLRYARSTAPESLELTAKQPMVGRNEDRVTYPQFYSLPDGDLLFLYRDGASGNGNAMLDRYDLQTDTWSAVAAPLVAGGGQRNAYLNTLAIDSKGGIHLSWCWRDTPDVATNHDICYAFSPDQGKSWQKSNGEKYALPITIETAEVVYPVAKNSELINQTSMTVDSHDRPVIATYWRDQDSQIPQYRIVWNNGQTWQASQVGNRTLGFRLSGGGTKKIPISRPQVVVDGNDAVYVIYRDEERNNGISVAVSKDADHQKWSVADLVTDPMGAWEPTYDPTVWKRDHKLDLFVQRVGQGDAETLENVPPQDVSVLEWTP